MVDFTLSVPDEVVDGNQQPPVSDDKLVETVAAPQSVAEEPTVEETVSVEPTIPTVSSEPVYKTIKVGHGSFKINEAATPEAVARARSYYINNNTDFYSGIDRETGASWAATKAVGDSLKPEDKLATLKKFYSDAMPFGEDNFIFTNKASGRVTLFNSPGFDLKDTAAYTRDASILVGSTLAGALGAFGGPIGATRAAVWGGAQTASVYDWLAQTFGGTVRTESVVARVSENVTQGLHAGVGEVIGRVAVPAAINVAQKVLGGGTAKSQQIYETLIRLRITPTAGTVTQGRGAGRIEGALGQAAASATRMKNQINEVIDGAQASATRLASKIGKPGSQQELGITIQKAAQNALARFSNQQTKLETKLSEKIGDDTLFSIDSVRGFYDELSSMGETMPKFYQRAFGDVKGILDDIIFDAAKNNGRIPYGAFREVRSFFGAKMSDMGEGVNRTMWKRLYAHMTDDLKFGADSLGYGKMFDDAVGFTRKFKTEYDPFLKKIVDLDAPERGYRLLMNSSKDGGTYFKKLQDQFSKAEWKDVSATIIQKMGYKNFGNEVDDAFSTATFLGNWGKLSKEAKQTLFSGMKDGKALQKELDTLIDGFSAISQNAKLAGHSNTGAVTHSLNLMNALGGDFTKIVLGALAVSGNIGAAAGTFAATFVGGVVTPNVAARLITNAAFVKWLAQGASVQTGKQAGEHIGRLIGISQANPEIAAEIDKYISVIKDGVTPVSEGTAQ